ncbi:MAG: hypothetical protein IKW58_00915 [Alphaproteobacteria bacterium]|nr:hypothetical protein [Alphaproteobacteria bacterium]
MKFEKITGKIVSAPVTLKGGSELVVFLLLETPDGCEEFYYQTSGISFRSLTQFKGTMFSKIALSAVGDEVQFDIYRHKPKGLEVCEIFHFENLTHKF